MSCKKISLTNNNQINVYFNYRRCDDYGWEYQVELEPFQTKNIWLVDGTYSTAFSFIDLIEIVDYGVFPPVDITNTPSVTPTLTPTTSVTPTQTPSNTQTPTSSQTPTTTQTPTNTITQTNTQTPSVTPTNTQTPTNTMTPTNTQTPSVTPTNTQTPTNTTTPTNTQTPTKTTTPTPTSTVTPSSTTPGTNLVYDLDAANYSAMPVNGSTILGTGSYTITMTNVNSSMSWNSANGGVFRKSTSNTADMFYGGPDYSTSSQPWTVFMAYKWDGGTIGRLLNANSVTPDFLMGLWGSGTQRMDIAYANTFVGSSSTVADTNWHFIWFTNDGLGTTNSLKSYIATNTAPSGTNGTANSSSGFNGLRLFGRYVNSTTSSEPVTGDVGFVKVYDKPLSLSSIQAQHALYKTRFGY